MMIRYPRVPRLDDDIYGQLVDQLFGTVGALAAAIAGALAMASAGVFIDGRPRFLICLAALAAVSVTRGIVAIIYNGSRQDTADRQAMRRWECAYAAPAVLWMAVVGVDTYVSMLAPDMLLRIFASITAIGLTGGITARNASRPWIVKTQVVVVLVPFGAALLQIGGLPYLAMLGMTMITFLGVSSSAQTFYTLLLSAMTNAKRNTFLANRFDTALNNMSHGLVMFDAASKVEVVNEKFLALFGVTPGRIGPGSTLREVVVSALEHRSRTLLTVDEYVALFESRMRARSHDDMIFRTLDGTTFDVKFHPTENGGSVISLEDVTDKRNAAAKIEFLAHYDELTKLPNRAMIKDTLASLVAGLSVVGDRPFSVLYLDLDDFKQVNDTLGHSAGDTLLAGVSARIKDAIHGDDLCARLAGDEFVIVHFTNGHAEASARLAGRLIEIVSAPYRIESQEVLVGLSIGIARGGIDGATAEDLLKHADLALYRAKEQGKGAFCFFEHGMTVEANARRERERDLRLAIAGDQIEVFFQPIVDLSLGTVASCEALVRWLHPTRGMILPDDFIKIAEASSLIVDLGAIVLRKACRAAMAWPDTVTVAVNLSAVQFRHDVVIEQVRQALASSGLPAQRLEVEITESLALGNLPTTREIIAELRGLGVRVALDDFGTGYSSLAYLQQIPFDKIKIDRSFVRDIGSDRMSRSLVRLMTSFAGGLEKTLVVEGVETLDQVTVLREMGVRQMQGYFFGRPMPAAALGDMSAVVRRIPSPLRVVA